MSKIFTPLEATHTLPLVRRIVTDVLVRGRELRRLDLLDDPSLKAYLQDLYWVDIIRERADDPNNAIHVGNSTRRAEQWNIERWTLRLERWGYEVCVRAAHAVAVWLHHTSATHTLAQIVALLERCVEAPEFREEAQARVRALLAGTGMAPSDAFFGQFNQADAPLLLGLVLADPSPERSSQALKKALVTLVATGVASEEDLREAVRTKLVPWALG